MKLIVFRAKSDINATLSAVFLDNSFECFGLEDEHREDKIAGETRIPAGIYNVRLRTVGGFHNRYKRKFPDIHQGMLQVMDVPGFEYILIHIGNTDKDTAGCLLVGSGGNTLGKLTITGSTAGYIKLYQKVIQAAIDEDLTIQYVDGDNP